MRYLSLEIPDYGTIDSDLPVPIGGLGTLQLIISAFFNILIIIAVLLALWSIGKGGLDIIMSRGVKEKFKSGRERVIWGIVGLILFLLCFFFIRVIYQFFGV